MHRSVGRVSEIAMKSLKRALKKKTPFIIGTKLMEK